MNTLTYIFLALLGTSLIAQWWLATRHIGYVSNNRSRVPSAFRRKVPLRAHRKAADYTIARTRLDRVESLFEAGVLLGLTLGGGLQALDSFWRGFALSPLLTGALFMLSLFFALAILDLPFNLYRTFAIEQRFGFNRMTWRLLIVDLLKSMVLYFVLGGSLILLVLWLMQASGWAWWLYAWVVWMSFSLFMAWAYPTLIAPLFNRFRPLRDKSIRTRLQRLLRRTGFRSRGLYVMDSSQRTTHGNAYFAGFGRNKRIVFFDSLLKTLAATEVEAVVAHELGHFKLKHIAKRLALMAIVTLVALAVLAWASGQNWFYTGLGIAVPSSHAALTLFVLVGPVFTFFLTPLLAYNSRRDEYAADAFAAAQTDGRALVRALVKLYRENATTLTPDPAFSAFYDSHPPAVARIAQLSGR